MLLIKLVPAEEAQSQGRIRDARCERCAWPRLDGSYDLTPSTVVLEQMRDPEIAYNRVIGVCHFHYSKSLADAYVEHGWKVIWLR